MIGSMTTANRTGGARERRPAPEPVLLEPAGDAGRLREAAGAAAAARGSTRAALGLAGDVGTWAPLPGEGRTRQLWELLATLAAVDLTLARTVEPHLDALAILHQSRARGLERVGAGSDSVWGVYAAEGAGARLDAVPQAGGWVVTGRKPWCSLAGDLSHALVTAHLPGDRGRQAFAVALRGPGVTPVGAPWAARGLADVPSGPLDLDRAPAVPVGGPGWYLTRPGFAWGGIGVAACWYGGAVAVGRRMLRQAGERELDQVGHMHLGAVDAALHAARLALGDAARAVDGGRAEGAAGATAALRARHVVARSAEDVLRRAAHALGPAPLALEEEHAARVADLDLYLRQEHAERDEAALGRAVLAGSASTEGSR